MATPSVRGLRPPLPKDATPPATPTPTNTPPSRAAESTKPLYAVSYRGVSAAVFADSRDQATLNVTLRKSYRDAEGKWQHTHTLKTDDLPAAVLALQKVYEWLVEAVRIRVSK